MGSNRKSSPETSKSRRPPATTLEARENQLINKAIDLSERQLDEGTASAQVITHYLKLGSTREKLEQQKLYGEIGLQKAKKEQIESSKRVEELYSSAMEAMRSYAGLQSMTRDDYED